MKYAELSSSAVDFESAPHSGYQNESRQEKAMRGIVPKQYKLRSPQVVRWKAKKSPATYVKVEANAVFNRNLLIKGVNTQWHYLPRFQFDAHSKLGKQVRTVFGDRILKAVLLLPEITTQEAFIIALLDRLEWRIYWIPDKAMLYLANDISPAYVKERFGNVELWQAKDVYAKTGNLDTLESLVERGITSL